MELSSEDIERLETIGFRLEDFAVIDGDGARLRNVDGYCYFYSCSEKKCQIYEKRPQGCCLYPVVYVVNKGATFDRLCPMRHTVTKQELRKKGKILINLLKTLDNEHTDY